MYKEEAARRKLRVRGPLEMTMPNNATRLANQFALIVAAGALGHVRRSEICGTPALLVAFLAPPMARHAALAGNLALLGAVHRRESAILFSHTDLLPQSHVLLRRPHGRRRMPFRGHSAATAVPRLKRTMLANPHQYRNLASVLASGQRCWHAAREIAAHASALQEGAIDWKTNLDPGGKEIDEPIEPLDCSLATKQDHDLK